MSVFKSENEVLHVLHWLDTRLEKPILVGLGEFKVRSNRHVLFHQLNGSGHIGCRIVGVDDDGDNIHIALHARCKQHDERLQHARTRATYAKNIQFALIGKTGRTDRGISQDNFFVVS